MKKSKLKRIDTPWTKFYGDVPKNLKYPEVMIYEQLFETAEKYPNYIAYEYFGSSVTYSKFVGKIHECAKGLKNIGVKEGDVVTICSPNMPQAIIMFYAINMVGAIANMIHPLSSESEMKTYFEISGSEYVLTLDLVCDKIINILKETKIKKIIVMSANNEMKRVMKFFYWASKGRKIKVDVNEEYMISWKDFLDYGSSYQGEYMVTGKHNEAAVILYSGGTTGKSKGILLSNRNFVTLAVQAHLMATPNGPGDSILCIMPIFHGFGLGVCIHTTLCIGMKCILIPEFNFKKFGDLIKKNKPNFVVGVPTLFDALTKCSKFKNDELSCVKNVICGGDALSTTLKNRVDTFLFEHGSSAKVKCGYGLTEGCAASCLTLDNFYREGSIGVPFPDVLYKIVKVGTHDQALPGEDGEICISGPTVMMGYVNNPKETVETLRIHEDGRTWLHTGDIASMDKDGFVYFKQRLKRVIVSNGYNIYPTYLEEIINKHPDVMTSIVIGVDHPYKVQVAKAFIVLKEGIEPSEAVKKSIKKYCEDNIARYSLPTSYEFRDSLPMTKVGKVSYGALVEEEKKNKEK